MAKVMVRDNEDDAWRVPGPLWKDIHSKKAKAIAQVYNSRNIYDKEYKAVLEEWEKEDTNMKSTKDTKGEEQ